MNTSEIPRSEWEWFCRSFTYQHAGWLVDLHESGPEASTRTPGDVGDALLLRIRLERTADGPEVVVVLLSHAAGPQITRSLSDPVRLRLESGPDNAHRALHVEARDGRRLSLTFPFTMPMEMLDGVNPAAAFSEGND